MKRKVMAVISVLCIMILLTGCTSASTIESKPFDVDGGWHYQNLLDGNFQGYAFHFQDDIKGQLMTQEVWQDGECTSTSILW